MRLALTLIALTVAGCVNAPAATDESPAATVVPMGALMVHRDGVLVPETAETLLGGVPQYVQHLVGTPGAEPSIGVTSSGAAFVTSDDLVRVSKDLGATWETSYDFGPIHTGSPLGGPTDDPVSNWDAMLWVDPLTDRVFAPLMFPILTCSEVIYSDDDGASWLDKPAGCGVPGMDHQRLATGPYVAGGTLQPTSLYPNAVYFCYSKIASYHCATSVDGGLHFPIDRIVAVGPAACGGPGGTPHAAPDGTVFAPLGGLGGCGIVAIGVSRDNGLSWEVKTPDVGDLGQDEIDPDITVTPDGTAYYVFRALKDHVVYMIRSSDGFETIEGPWRVAPPGVTSTNFAQITSGTDGRVAIAYAGTRDTDAFANDAPDKTRWHLFVSTSFDAAAASPTFVTAQVTPDADPLQIGSIHYGGGSSPDRNLLEFIDAATGPDGRVWVVFTDGCTNECAGKAGATPDDSRSRDTAVGVLAAGPSLSAALPGH